VPDDVVLGLLKSQPAHGYELLAYFRDNSKLGRIWTMSTSQLYAVLKRLEVEEYISGSQVEVPDAPPRVMYSLTKMGEDRLLAWLYDQDPPVSIHKIRVMFLSRLYIALLLQLPFEDVVNQQNLILQNRLKILENEKLILTTQIENLAVELMIRQIESAISWLQYCKSILV